MTFRLCFHGAESTGKSVLADKLSQELGVPWVPEYGRTYCEERGTDLVMDDLLAIAEGQQAAVDAVDQRAAEDAGHHRGYAGQCRHHAHQAERPGRLQHQQRDRDHGEGITERGERLPRPESQEVSIAQRGEMGEWHADDSGRGPRQH